MGSHPVRACVRRPRPIAGVPDISAADRVPVAADPHIVRAGASWLDSQDAWRRRCADSDSNRELSVGTRRKRQEQQGEEACGDFEVSHQITPRNRRTSYLTKRRTNHFVNRRTNRLTNRHWNRKPRAIADGPTTGSNRAMPSFRVAPVPVVQPSRCILLVFRCQYADRRDVATQATKNLQSEVGRGCRMPAIPVAQLRMSVGRGIVGRLWLGPVAFAAVLGWAGLVSEAQDAVRSGQTFRSGVDLVSVDVSVLDRNRIPIAGLTAARLHRPRRRQAASDPGVRRGDTAHTRSAAGALDAGRRAGHPDERDAAGWPAGHDPL